MSFREKVITLLGGQPTPATAQTQPEPRKYAESQIVYRSGLSTPFDMYFDQYAPTKQILALYDIIREAIPLADVAIRTRARMLSGIRLDGLGNSRVQAALDQIASVRVGWFQRGLNTLIEQAGDAALHKGFDVFELVPEVDNKSINRTVIGVPDRFRINADKPGVPVIEQEVTPGSYLPMPRQDLLFLQIFGTSTGGHYGRPIFASCPFIAKIIVRILTAVDAVVWRFADPTIVSVLRGGTASDLDDVAAAATGFGTELSKAMATRKSGGVYDVQVGVPGDGEFKIILLGADAKPIDINIDYKLALEQLISASEVPPWKFGLSWSTTERLSTNQNEAAVSVIEGNRKAMEPNIERFVDTSLMLFGLTGAKWRMEWDPINLTDEAGKADARLKNAQAQVQEIAAAQSLLGTGLMTEEEFIAYAVAQGFLPESRLKGSSEARVTAIKDALRVKRLMMMSGASTSGVEL